MSLSDQLALNRRERPRCPERSEEYRETERRLHGQRTPALKTGESHNISTAINVVIRDGSVALKVNASCVCGWRSSTVIRGDE